MSLPVLACHSERSEESPHFSSERQETLSVNSPKAAPRDPPPESAAEPDPAPSSTQADPAPLLQSSSRHQRLPVASRRGTAGTGGAYSIEKSMVPLIPVRSTIGFLYPRCEKKAAINSIVVLRAPANITPRRSSRSQYVLHGNISKVMAAPGGRGLTTSHRRAIRVKSQPRPSFPGLASDINSTGLSCVSK